MDLPASPSVKVRLKSDLTHYHPDLIAGCEGYTIGPFGRSSRLSKHYVGVWFPGIRIVDVNWAMLEIVSEQPPIHSVVENRPKPESFKMARQVLKRLGL